MKDMKNNVAEAILLEPTSISADTNSKYVDTAGAVGVGFRVECYPSTADSSNYFTPVLYGTNSATPGTATEYTAVAADEIEGGLFTAVKATTAGDVQVRGLKQHLYRYYYVKVDETLTAVGIYSVSAQLSMGSLPCDTVSPTTGAVT